MSIDLDWSSLDYHLTQSVTQFLSTAFASAPRPNFIGPLKVESFSFGDTEPTLELVDIRDVYKEFLQDPIELDQQDEDQEEEVEMMMPQLSRSRTRSRSPHPLRGTATPPHSFDPPSPTHSHLGGGGDSHSHNPYAPPPSSLPFSSAPSPSFQVHIHLTYSGTLSLGISTSLLINYPNPNFMSLPLSLTITSLSLEATLVVAFEGSNRSIHLSLLDPGGTGLGGGGKKESSAGNRILKQAQVESEVGQSDKHVLKNVGKVEKFVLEVARKTIENEIVFPNFQTILF